MNDVDVMLPPDLIDTLGEPSKKSFEAARAPRTPMRAQSDPPTVPPTQPHAFYE